ncbi:transcription factor bHLH-like [Tripterygium wilfordii]|uniref:Transcription factor bHLH-like n=1 Tax=Tripterygium wilfordii TaxID=458696 RepID=A0A7J7CZ83_TRIWF|nr:transcription factor bHLH110 [Tripterygium wilfordii]KAF5739370.1 transcription factor bHLH-like [Tripterygium wilfordii]
MESGNNLHLHLQPQQQQHPQLLHHQDHQLFIGSSPSSCSSLASPISNYAWTPNITLNSSVNFSENCHGVVISSNPIHHKNDMLFPPPLSSMIQDLGAHDHQWSTSTNADCFPKFTQMLNRSSSIEDRDSQRDLNNVDDLSQKLLLKTLSSGFPIMNGHHHQFSPSGDQFYNGNCPRFGRGSFSQIYPSINISNLNHQSVPAFDNISTTTTTNLQALDLLSSCSRSSIGSCNYRGASSDHHNDNLGMYKTSSLSFGLDRLQQPTHHITSSCSSTSTKILPFNNNELTEAKRASSLGKQSAPKKSRLESRSSCPPFKVRKEKLGDRIAALQQLVAPFGKTDTASVLMEAIGYIKFLQNQVETLSVPYMKSSRNKTGRTTQGGSSVGGSQNGEAKQDLRSQGLCLVPLSCMSYVSGDFISDGGGGGIWPPAPNFG